MEPEPSKNVTKKLKFMPKIPPRRVAQKTEVKAEKVEDIDPAQAMNLMRQFQQRSLRAKPKIEEKVRASQIAFGLGAASTKLKSYGTPKGGNATNRDQGAAFNGGTQAPAVKEYVEPWDYYSYYPVTHPMRRPYSGNPALLDEEEFGEAAEAQTFDENSINHAEELGLMEEIVEPKMFFLQLPSTMPMPKRLASADGCDLKENSKPSGGATAVAKPQKFDELPTGFMGKMLVYRSGAVKLKLGDTLYDVSPGMGGIFAQDVVAINKAQKQCFAIAEIEKRAIVTPDVDAILKSIPDL